jgi:HK97 family phage major capsid protein
MERKLAISLNLNYFGVNRIEEIEQRLSAIGTELETRDGNLTAEELQAFSDEIDSLKAEKRTLLETAQKRASLLDAIANDRPSESGGSATVLSRFTNTQTQKRANSDDEFDCYTASLEYRKAFMNYVMRGTPMSQEIRQRSANEVTHTEDIGSVIPQPVLNRIIEKMESSGMILPLVTRTSFRGSLSIPTSSVKPVAIWVDEGAGSPTQKKPTGKITFMYHKLRCAVAVTLEVDTMALSIFETRLIENVVEAMTVAVETAIISGSGDGQPKGIITQDTNDGQELSVSAISYQTILDAEAALPMAYERNVRWCMNKATFYKFFGIVDTNKQPIARIDHGITGSAVRILLGRPVTLCDYLPTFATGATGLDSGECFAFLFNFRDYILNTNLGMGIRRYIDNETDDTIARAVMLTDGQVVDNGSLVKLIKG